MVLQRSAWLTAWLALAELALPFIWIRIGPMGKAYYGPAVPDIYILGAIVLGKDLGFLPLAMATVFQLIFGMLFIYCAFAVVQRIRRGKRIMLLVTVQMILLLLFPLWLGFYTAGVINNSDGAAADLRVYPHIGLVVYAALLVLVANTLYRSSQGRTVDGPPPG